MNVYSCEFSSSNESIEKCCSFEHGHPVDLLHCKEMELISFLYFLEDVCKKGKKGKKGTE